MSGYWDLRARDMFRVSGMVSPRYLKVRELGKEDE